MFCVSSIDVLQKYYDLFQKKKEEGKHQLKIATIFSYGTNEESKDADGIYDEPEFEWSQNRRLNTGILIVEMY